MNLHMCVESSAPTQTVFVKETMLDGGFKICSCQGKKVGITDKCKQCKKGLCES